MKYLVDSDFFFGLLVKEDKHHENCKELFKKIVGDEIRLVTLNIVLQETATVLSNKRGQKAALLFLDRLENLPLEIMNLDSELEKLTWSIFKKQVKKGTSFVDCANLATLQKYKLDGILSFDKFYTKEVMVK